MAPPKPSITKNARPARFSTPAEEFRDAITSAQANGADASSMVLHLTRRDEASLRRDRAVPLEDIRYAEGEMRFLGVRVVAGEASGLTIASE